MLPACSWLIQPTLKMAAGSSAHCPASEQSDVLCMHCSTPPPPPPGGGGRDGGDGGDGVGDGGGAEGGVGGSVGGSGGETGGGGDGDAAHVAAQPSDV